MGSFKEDRLKKLVSVLDAEGKRILIECEQERTYTHRTKNLYDSYGYGIYVYGKLLKKGFISSSPTATKTKKWYGVDVEGREQIENFLNREYKPSKGIDLVIAAAIPYAHALENASSGQRQKYRVISMSYNKLLAISGVVKGSEVFNISRSKVR